MFLYKYLKVTLSRHSLRRPASGEPGASSRVLICDAITSNFRFYLNRRMYHVYLYRINALQAYHACTDACT